MFIIKIILGKLTKSNVLEQTHLYIVFYNFSSNKMTPSTSENELPKIPLPEPLLCTNQMLTPYYDHPSLSP